MSRPTSFDAIALKPDEFRLLRDLLAGRTGLYFPDDARSTLERRLRERLVVLGVSSFGEYCHYLRFNARAAAEWDEAVELLTTNETYFFREAYQLRAFHTEVLPLLAEQAKGRKRLSIWSAGCSTGEEVYTLAILVAQSGIFEGWDVRIFGSDISRRCVTAARRGVYGAASFRSTSPEIKRAWFVEQSDGFHVVDRIRAMCHFGSMNLLDEERLRLLGRADAVFCRNVLIYFDQHARRRVIDSFHERLYPGGVLFLGHSESLLNVTTAFELLHLKEDLVYRKPLAAKMDGPAGGTP
ncbi:MAG TPA: protein-glutamate O-methyltransferase CheR [Polyangiaceae bacterium]